MSISKKLPRKKVVWWAGIIMPRWRTPILSLIFSFTLPRVPLPISADILSFEADGLSISFEGDQITKVLLDGFSKGYEAGLSQNRCANQNSKCTSENLVKYLKDLLHDLPISWSLPSPGDAISAADIDALHSPKVSLEALSSRKEFQPVSFHIHSPRKYDTIVLHGFSLVYSVVFEDGSKTFQQPGEMCISLTNEGMDGAVMDVGCVVTEDGSVTLSSYRPEEWALYEGKHNFTFTLTMASNSPGTSYSMSVLMPLQIAPFNHLENNNKLSIEEIGLPRETTAGEIPHTHHCVSTLLYSETYLPGVIALQESLRTADMGHLPFFVLVPTLDEQDSQQDTLIPDLAPAVVQLLTNLGAQVVAVRQVSARHGTALLELGDGIWLKLRLWDALAAKGCKGVMYLDADVLVLQSFAEIFNLDMFAGVTAYIPGGAFYLRTSEQTLEHMQHWLRQQDGYPYGEQDFLNHFFRGRKLVLPNEYHCWADTIGQEPEEVMKGEGREALSTEACRIVEFGSCGERRWKPWHGRTALPPGERLCKYIPSQELEALILQWELAYSAGRSRAQLIPGGEMLADLLPDLEEVDHS